MPRVYGLFRRRHPVRLVVEGAFAPTRSSTAAPRSSPVTPGNSRQRRGKTDRLVVEPAVSTSNPGFPTRSRTRRQRERPLRGRR